MARSHVRYCLFPVYLFVLLIYSIFPFNTLGEESYRTALIIGNGDYVSAPLKNPVNDARDIADVLRQQGFTVIHRENADRSQMREAIRVFEERLAKNGGTGLFYFAGHGVQLQGQNYLVPIGADIKREYEVPDETIQADLVLQAMAYANNDMNIVILDACRNNPFPRSFRSASRGLARMKTMGSGMLIAYATAPGSVASDGDGKNGVYTKHLLEAINTPGLSIEQVFKSVRQNVMQETNNGQTPWEESSLTGDFYFIVAGNAHITVHQPAQQVPGTGTKGDDKELTLWRGISSSENVEDYTLYLEQYPEGIFAELAKSRIEQSGRLTAGRGAAQEGSAKSEGKMQGSWKLDYVENNRKNYLLFTLGEKGEGSAEGAEPDGTWWAEPVGWTFDNMNLTIEYVEHTEKYSVAFHDSTNLVLLGISGDNKGERLAFKKVQEGESEIVLQKYDQLLLGTWKDSWEEDGVSAFQQFTLNKDGTVVDQGKTPEEKWMEKGHWQIEDNNILVITSDGYTQRYIVVHAAPDYVDLIDLSAEYNGIGSRFKRID